MYAFSLVASQVFRVVRCFFNRIWCMFWWIYKLILCYYHRYFWYAFHPCIGYSNLYIGVKDLASVIGALVTLSGLGAMVGAPITESIIHVNNGHYLGAILFASFTAILGSTALLYLRIMHSRKLLYRI